MIQILLRSFMNRLYYTKKNNNVNQISKFEHINYAGQI